MLDFFLRFTMVYCDMIRAGNVQLCNKDVGALVSIVVFTKHEKYAISLSGRTEENIYRITKFIQEIQKATTFIPRRWGKERYRFAFFNAKLARNYRKLVWALLCCLTRSRKFYLPEELRKNIWAHSSSF